MLLVTTPSWPGSGSANFPRGPGGNTLGCITQTNNVLVSQHFFALRLTRQDVSQVLDALANASVVTNLQDPRLVHSGGPSEIVATGAPPLKTAAP
ncbi:hypothetical protein [Variovorax sp. YR216]|uniref:hypothetical protein n=1 Tax=Variovorax sp. YR216 TaxID=1882828 RepID=UPI000B867163|nr:hypothetical protein [Variovorax sp. YR216]